MLLMVTSNTTIRDSNTVFLSLRDMLEYPEDFKIFVDGIETPCEVFYEAAEDRFTFYNSTAERFTGVFGVVDYYFRDLLHYQYCPPGPVDDAYFYIERKFSYPRQAVSMDELIGSTAFYDYIIILVDNESEYYAFEFDPINEKAVF